MNYQKIISGNKLEIENGLNIANQLVPMVVEQTARGERGMDIYSRPVSYTHLDVYKRQLPVQCRKGT